MMGGGGGAATTNDGTGTPGAGLASSGASGGGLIFVRAGEIAGNGTLSANGNSANSTLLNDASGGGGAGGSVYISALRTVPGASISVQARGGNGGSNTGTGVPHGPGGGGGGGFVAYSPGLAVSAILTGGSAGTTSANTVGVNYGALGGVSGVTSSINTADVVGTSSGGECTPTVSKNFAPVSVPIGGTSRLTVTVTNNNPDLALTNMGVVDNYPAGVQTAPAPNTGSTCAIVTPVGGTPGSTSSGVSAATINAASACSYSIDVTATTTGSKVNTIPAGALSGSYGTVAVNSLAAASAILDVSGGLTITKASLVYSDPSNGTVLPKAISGAFVTYTITVTNAGALTIDSNSILIVDATPPNMKLVVTDYAGVGSGPVNFSNGTPSSTLTYNYSGLSSQTDDLDFSSAAVANSYVPSAQPTGIDPLVTKVTFKPKGSMAGNSSFIFRVRYRVE